MGHRITILCLLFLFCVFSGITYADLTDGLVAYYPFNGNANDESGNGNHGVMTGHEPDLTSDRFENDNSAYSFNGEDDYIEITPQSDVSAIGDYTISVWTYIIDWKSQPSVPGIDYDAQYVFDGHSHSSTTQSDFYRPGFTVEYIGNTSYEKIWDGIMYNNGTQNSLNEADFNPLGKWYHHIYMRSGTYTFVYIDGKLINELDTQRDDLLNMQHNWFIGTFSGNNPYYWAYPAGYNFTVNGMIDDLRIYDRALSKLEILELLYENKHLLIDNNTLSEAGGTINFALDAGPNKSNRKYLMLGSVTGIEPGHPLPGGQSTLPLNWDIFTDLVLYLANSTIFPGFIGTMDVDGKSTAQIYWSGPSMPPSALGTIMHFAYCLGWPWEFASNPVEIEIVP